MSATAASPQASTDAASPVESKPVINRKPSLIMKPLPMPSATSPPPNATTPTLSLTSKEWIIPPRPKPGRKPATDTPPTKRKAQNRAAQRAFRERRAARVGELEVQIKQVEDEYEREQDQLHERISKLETDVEQYRAELATWIDRCRKLEKELQAARDRQSHTTQSTPKSRSRNRDEDAEPTVGCGNCTLETRCQCIDDAFDAMGGEPGQEGSQAEKRSRSPLRATKEKRIKLEPKETLEIDFTAMYSRPQSSPSGPDIVSPTSVIADPCGFCSDGTPCICAEMAAAQEQAQSAAMHIHRAGPGVSRSEIQQLAQFTPPPSEGDVSISASSSKVPVSRASGPGTCAQCQADPNSTLFCKSLAASRAKSQTTSGDPSEGCCGGKSANGSCCMSNSSSTAVALRSTRSRTAASTTITLKKASSSSSSTSTKSNSRPSVTLTCADAYTTLSRHPAYERASSEIATWLPKLHASEVPQTKTLGKGGSESRPALEIDAANVMAVLKDFDRRFGQNC